MTTFTVAVSDNLEIGFFADGGETTDPVKARQDLQKLIDMLGADPSVVKLDDVGPIENHRDQDRMVELHDLTHA